MEEKSNGKRIEWLDAAKGIAIALVVVGHTMRGLVHARIMDSNPTVDAIDCWIYAFHMPLFFFLSGRLVVRSAEQYPTPNFIFDRVATIAYPYFVWSIITILIKAILGPIPTTPRTLEDLRLILDRPIEQFWFLYALFVLTVAFKLLYSNTLKSWPFLIVAIAIHPAAAIFSSDNPVVISVRSFAIYFAAGAVIKSVHFINVGSGLAGIVAAAGLAGAAGCVFLPSNMGPIFAATGILGACSLAVLLTRLNASSGLQYLGRYSLEIFVAHTIASAGTRVALSHVGIAAPFFHLTIGIAAGLLGPLFLAQLFQRCNFRYAYSFRFAGVRR